MRDLALQKPFLQTIETTSPQAKNYYGLRKMFTDYLTKLNVPHFDSCCFDEEQSLISQPVRYNSNEDTLERFNTETGGWAELQTGSALSDNTISSYLLSTNGEGQIEFNGPKMRDMTNREQVSLYKMPMGNLTANFDTMVKSGAMSSATIALDDGFDNIIVGGSDQNSYIQFPFILTHNRVIYRMRVRVDAVGGTAPILGFRNIWPGGTYSNFSNPQFYCYFNLATGALTTTTTGTTLQASYNGWLGTVAAGDIVELEIQYEYMKPRIVKMTKVGDILSGEVSSQVRLKNSASDGDWAQITHPAIIMADGTYTLLDYELISLDDRPFFLIDGDSMGCSVRVPYEGSLVGHLNAKLPYTAACMAAGTKRTEGHLATLWEVVRLKPKYLIIFNYLDALFPNYADPANGSHATWSANFNRYVDTIKGLGITPIFVYPETWAPGILGANATVCGHYETYLNTNYPTDLKVKVLTSESTYDSTGFHYSTTANGIIADKILTLMETNNLL